MSATKHLYLNTLEIEPLEVGKSYNPLPSHMTLMSRYWSELQPGYISAALMPLFAQVGKLTLKFGDNEIIGPKMTPVHLVIPSPELIILHNQLRQELDDLGVTFAYPQFEGTSWKPHVSQRQENDFIYGVELQCEAAYLIEVARTSDGVLRNVCSRFSLES